MKKRVAISALTLSAAILPACMTNKPANTGQTYQCDRGSMLKVSFLQDGALVRINNGPPLAFEQAASTVGATYEYQGYRLVRTGNGINWSSSQRIAPENCRVLMTIN